MTYWFRRWLAGRGLRLEDGTRPTKLHLNGKRSALPRHGSREIGAGLRKAILKQLGLQNES